MDISKIVNSDEKVAMQSGTSLGKCIGYRIRTNLVLIFMWILMNGFFLYLMLLEKIAYKYWFVSIPFIGFDILGILTIYLSVIKYYNSIADNYYILTDKAIYYYNASSYKHITRIEYTQVKRFEKGKLNSNIFYICAENTVIKVENIKNSSVFYSQMAKKINSI